MINGNSLHYIASGVGHTRIKSFSEQDVSWIRSSLKKMQTPDYEFGFLYNAYAEPLLGDHFSSMYLDDLCDIHADSGGLQMVTLGREITDEFKEKIYRHQAKCSTIAMSFDEIPETSGNGVTDFANRRFDSHLVEEKAKASGINLYKQLKLFSELKTKSKPLLIAQGNCSDSYCKWVDIVQKQIPKELLVQLGGIALAGASMGNGDLENVRTAFYYTQMDLKFDCKQIHLLGVGSLSRFIPTMVFMKSGLYRNLVISIDSTTTTGNLSRYTWFDKNVKPIKLGRLYKPEEYATLFEQMQFFTPCCESPRELYDLFTGPRPSEMTDEESIRKFLQTHFAMFLVSSKNTLDAFVKYLKTSDPVKMTRKSMYIPMKSLQEVKNLQDYQAWERNFARSLKTNPVKPTTTNTLEGFFV